MYIYYTHTGTHAVYVHCADMIMCMCASNLSVQDVKASIYLQSQIVQLCTHNVSPSQVQTFGRTLSFVRLCLNL